MIRQSKRNGRATEVSICVHVWLKIEVSAISYLEIDERTGTRGEPRNLVEEIVVTGITRIVENCAREIYQDTRNGQPRTRKGIEERAILSVDVKVAQAKQIMMPAITLFRPISEDVCYLGQLWNSRCRGVSKENMQRN